MCDLPPRVGCRYHDEVAKAKRGAPVIQRTLDTTLDQLGRVGYVALRVEDVAQKAGVHKTTVYRRWPTKEALVRAALLSLVEREGGRTIPDTGTLRGDLTQLLERKRRFATSPHGCAIIRVLGDSGSDPELLAIVRSLREARDVVIETFLRRERDRGTIRPEVDVRLAMELIQLALERTPWDRKAGPRIKALVDILLHGIASAKKLRN